MIGCRSIEMWRGLGRIELAGAGRLGQCVNAVIAGGPQIAWDSCALHNMHNPLLHHCGNGT